MDWVRWWIASLLLGQTAAHACIFDEQPRFEDLLNQGLSVAIVTPVRIEGTPPRPRSEGPVHVLFQESVKVHMRIVEGLVGPRPRLRTLTYIRSWCGGHRVEADRYYVLAVGSDAETLMLPLGSEQLLGLGDEYAEELGAQVSQSALVRALLHFVESGDFTLDAALVRRYRALTEPVPELPSTGPE